ncbi:MAG: hypothetical protein ACM3SU_02580 [Acidobacteriota bacterium]
MSKVGADDGAPSRSEEGGRSPSVSRRKPTILALCAGALFCLAAWAAADPVEFKDINPDDSGPTRNCPAPCPSGGSGGRVHRLASSKERPDDIYAASELGGLFKSVDKGQNWSHVDSFLPTRAWDVAVSPGGDTVYATSFYDGRVSSTAGIQVSYDRGATWQHPATATPPAGFCTAGRVSQPSAFGISIRPGAINEVLAGTNCGLARSTDFGTTWTFLANAPRGPLPLSVWDVVALPGGLTYACGEQGVLRSSNGTAWRKMPDPSDATGPYRGYCSIAASGAYPNFVVVVFARTTYFDAIFDIRQAAYFASFDYGLTWTKWAHPDGAGQKRVPMVAVNRRSDGLDVWLGAGNLFRVPCTDVPIIGLTCSATRFGTFTDAGGDVTKVHGDTGDILFDPEFQIDACPLFYSSDGGIYVNSETAPGVCQDPVFLSANVGLHAELPMGMTGVDHAASTQEDLYLALQDNGLFTTTHAEAFAPAWTHIEGADWFDAAADEIQSVTVDSGYRLEEGDPGMANGTLVVNAPAPAQPWYSVFTDVVDQFATFSYFLATDAGPDLAYTSNLTGVTAQNGNADWTSLGWPAADAGYPCGVRSSRSLIPQLFVMSSPSRFGGACLWRSQNQLWYTAPALQPWQRMDKIDGICPDGGFGIFAIDRLHPNRIYASCTGVDPPVMIRTEDLGGHWQVDQNLTDLMTGPGKFVPKVSDPDNGVTFSAPGDNPQPAWPGIVQPVMVAFDPTNQNLLVAGGYESGLFISSDGGKGWALLSDPFTPSAAVPHLPRPFWAEFSHDADGALDAIYVGSVGRGAWRIRPATTDLRLQLRIKPVGCRVCPRDPCPTCTVQPREFLDFESVLSNEGSDDGGNPIFQQTLPPGLKFRSLTAPEGWACETPDVGASGRVRCTASSITPRESVTIVVGTQVTRHHGTLNAEASIVSNAIDPAPLNNRVATANPIRSR